MKTNTIRVGVTGQRIIPHLEDVRASVQQVIARIEKDYAIDNGAVHLVVVSPLAEGADRLVAHEVVKRPGSMLIVPLPLEINDYMTDFETQQSKDDFQTLLAMAHDRIVLPQQPVRGEAYKAVGQYVVDNCDVLIALWDGKKSRGRGGTAEIVAYARKKKKSLFWIHTDKPGRIKEENNLLRLFNEEDPLEEKQRDKSTTKLEEFLANILQENSHLRTRLQTVLNHFLPHYVKADLLAVRYQRFYMKWSRAIYLLAAAAVIIIAGQYIFELNHWFGAGEIIVIVCILLIIVRGNRKGWHRRWVDYRFLAEQLRYGIFMAFLSSPPQMVAKENLAFQPINDAWNLKRFNTIWETRPALSQLDPNDLETLKEFVREAWLENQRDFHAKKKKSQMELHEKISQKGELFFWLTLVAASLHLLPHLLHLLHIDITFMNHDMANKTLTFFAIAFPAIATSCSGLRAHFDYKKIADRSAMMEVNMDYLIGKLKEVNTLQQLHNLVDHTKALMVQENADWCVTIGVHPLEPA